MKYILILAILLSNMTSNGTTLDTFDKFNLFKKQINYFINESKQLSVGRGKYDIYCVNLITYDLDTNSFCFGISLISNEYDINIVKAKYLFYIDSNVILINVENWFNKIHFNRIDSE